MADDPPNIASQFEEIAKAIDAFKPERRVRLQDDFFKFRKQKIDYYDELCKTQISDHTAKIASRRHFKYAMIILLFAQNATIFSLVYIAFFRGELKQLEILFGALTAATLTETIGIVKIIVDFFFHEIDYTKTPIALPSSKDDKKTAPSTSTIPPPAIS